MSDGRQTGPIFIGGAGRSGTTLLRVMLNAHPSICCGPELKILPDVARLRQTLTGPLKVVMDSYFNAPADVDRSLAAFVDQLVTNFCCRMGKRRWAEKTPHNVLQMVELGQIFPDAQFLHVIRDGRDVACSLVRMDWQDARTGQKIDYIQSIGRAAQYWREIVQAGRRQAAHPSLAGRLMEVRYESLVTETEDTLRDVLEFIGEPWDPAVLEYHKSQDDNEALKFESSTDQTKQPVYTASIGRWKEQMSDLEKIDFKSAAGVLLNDLGYVSNEW